MAGGRRLAVYQLVQIIVDSWCWLVQKPPTAGAITKARWPLFLLGPFPNRGKKTIKKRPKITNFRPRAGTFPAEARAMFLTNIY